jgi:predicted MFS family arabinose efflux permease
VPVLTAGNARRFGALFVIEAASTTAYGVVFTFLPIAAPALPSWVVPFALLSQQVTTATMRWLAGLWADRHDSRRLLRWAILVGAVGVAGGMRAAHPWAVIAGMALFGIGFGTVRTATLLGMLRRAGTAQTSTASVLWNLAFDSGTGLGAAAGGVVFQTAGHPATFAAAGLLLICTLAVPNHGSSRHLRLQDLADRPERTEACRDGGEQRNDERSTQDHGHQP